MPFVIFFSHQTDVIVDHMTIFELLFEHLTVVGYTRKGNVIAFRKRCLFQQKKKAKFEIKKTKNKKQIPRTRKKIKNKERVICKSQVCDEQYSAVYCFLLLSAG